jgi:hypothetical protein
MKEEDYQPIVFHIEKNSFKDTFDTTLFKKERPKPNVHHMKEKEKIALHQRSGKSPILNFDFNVSRTKVEKIEIYADDDPYLFAEEFASKFSKFFLNLFLELNKDKKIKLRQLIEKGLSENVNKIY